MAISKRPIKNGSRTIASPELFFRLDLRQLSSPVSGKYDPKYPSLWLVEVGHFLAHIIQNLVIPRHSLGPNPFRNENNNPLKLEKPRRKLKTFQEKWIFPRMLIWRDSCLLSERPNLKQSTDALGVIRRGSN